MTGSGDDSGRPGDDKEERDTQHRNRREGENEGTGRKHGTDRGAENPEEKPESETPDKGTAGDRGKREEREPTTNQEQSGETPQTGRQGVGKKKESRPTAGGHPEEKPPRVGDGDKEEDGWKLFVQDIVTSVSAVVLIGVYLFAISGVWPPMVAVESESMSPNMEVNDLVFVMESERFQPSGAHGETGVVTAATGAEIGYKQFGRPGDVIVFAPNGNDNRTPIIHRAMLWVEEGENWCDRAEEAYLGGSDRCTEAPHAGFITKGDNNPQYDQTGAGQLSEPVKPKWIVGTAEIRLPRLGWLRLRT
jgi:signal peptidase